MGKEYRIKEHIGKNISTLDPKDYLRNNFDGISYQAKFQTQKDEWLTIKVPFNTFSTVFRGRTIPNQPELFCLSILHKYILQTFHQRFHTLMPICKTHHH